MKYLKISLFVLVWSIVLSFILTNCNLQQEEQLLLGVLLGFPSGVIAFILFY